MSDWTPGPWEFQDNPDVTEEGSARGAWVIGPPMCCDMEFENKADARLIALAPEMARELALGLKIMRGLEELGNIVTDGPSWSDRVGDLLARAR